MKEKLYVPEDYKYLSKEQKEDICNGCGPEGFLSFLIPDTLYFLNISEACNIHDYMYYIGENEYDREEADRVFLNNMIRIIDNKTKWKWLKKLRYRRAKLYYKKVRDYGSVFFWKDKNKEINLMDLVGSIR